MAARERPLSPFLIYKPQITSVLSILHRMTGIAMSVGAILLVLWLSALASGPQSFERWTGWLSGLIGLGLLIGVSACFFYHLCNGVRHLFWDVGVGFELTQAYASGWAVVAATCALTAGFWLFAFGVGA